MFSSNGIVFISDVDYMQRLDIIVNTFGLWNLYGSSVLMKVFCLFMGFHNLQETKEKIGTIVDVHNSGASDLLRVQLTALKRGKDVLIWIPFVNDIVPVVDVAANRVEISPPEGLLDLNVPEEGITRKELRKEV